jgi:hypothetical protein
MFTKTGDKRLAISITELSQDVLVADWLPSGPMLCVPCHLIAAHQVSALRPTARSIRKIMTAKSTAMVLYDLSFVAASKVVSFRIKMLPMAAYR